MFRLTWCKKMVATSRSPLLKRGLSGVTPDLLATLSMNYKNGSKTHAGLVANLVRNSLIRSRDVEATMLKVDRALFCAPGETEPYEDKPRPIGPSSTITAPHMHAVVLEALLPALQVPRCRSVDIGTGSGYLAACFSLLSGDGSVCYAVESGPEMVQVATDCVVRRWAGPRDAVDRIVFVQDDGLDLKAPAFWEPETCEAIHVGCAVSTIPDKILRLLSPTGRLVVPVYDGSPGPATEQNLLMVTREQGPGPQKFRHETLMRVIYSPMVVPVDRAAEHAAAEAERQKAAARVDVLADDVRKWQAVFAANNGRKPSGAEICLTPLFSQYQDAKKELARIERRIKSLQ